MKTKALAVGLVGLVLTAACAPGEVDDSALDHYLCSREAVGDNYQELARGDFTPRDLAALSDSSGEREDELRDAGFERGKFVYYKSVLERPPFEPPFEVACQAMQFEGPEAAAAWVSALDGESAADALIIGRLPDGERRAGDAQVPEADARSFWVTAGGDDSRTTVTILVAAEGSYVRSLAFGTQAVLIDPPYEALAAMWNQR